MHARLLRTFGVAAVLFVLAFSTPVSAQDTDSWAYKLPYELMSPFCPGRTLAQCTSQQADQLRQWILMQEAAGATEEEVRANLVARFGDSILQTPKAEGWGLSAYVLPAVAFVLGGGLVVFFLQRMVRRTQPSDPGPQLPPVVPVSRGTPEEEAELARQVDEELRRAG